MWISPNGKAQVMLLEGMSNADLFQAILKAYRPGTIEEINFHNEVSQVCDLFDMIHRRAPERPRPAGAKLEAILYMDRIREFARKTLEKIRGAG